MSRNSWYLCIEIFWAAILTSAAAFNGVLAVRMGASNTDMGLLSSIPALLAIGISIPAGRFLQSRNRRKPWVLWSLALTRAGYLLLAILPFIHVLGLPSGQLVVGLLILISIPAQFFGIGFTPILAEAVQEGQRASVFAARNIINGVTTSLFIFLAGQWLNAVEFPINYQILYSFGFAASMLSLFFLTRVNAAEAPRPAVVQMHLPIQKRLGAFYRSLRAYPAYYRMLQNTFLQSMGLWFAGPLYVQFYVRELGAGEAWIGLNSTVASVGGIVGYAFWRWAMAHLGEERTLRITILWAGGFPLLLGILHNLALIPFATALNSVMVAGSSLSYFNILLKAIPEDRRPEYGGIYSTIMNIGAFICPLISVVLAGSIGFGTMLVFSGVLAVIGSISFWIWPMRFNEPQPGKNHKSGKT